MVFTATEYQHHFSGSSQVLILVHQPAPLSQRKRERIHRNRVVGICRGRGEIGENKCNFISEYWHHFVTKKKSLAVSIIVGISSQGHFTQFLYKSHFFVKKLHNHQLQLMLHSCNTLLVPFMLNLPIKNEQPKEYLSLARQRPLCTDMIDHSCPP